MPPRIKNTPTHADTSYSALYGAAGAGQSFTVARESSLPHTIAPTSLRIRAAVPRLFGSAVVLGAFAHDLYNAYQKDQMSADNNYTQTRRQVVKSTIAAGAGLGVGSLTGFATAGILALGAPVSMGVGLGVGGLVAATYAASYAYAWADDQVKQWIN